MKLLRSNDGWAQTAEQLAEQNERLTVQAAALRQQNGYLRKANRVRPHVKLCEKAEASAKLLALWHVTGWRTGKASCKAYGMTEGYFFAGRALLVLAGLHDGYAWLSDNADTIEGKLRMASELARKRPELLAQNMPNSRRPREFQSAVNDVLFGRS